MMKLEPQILHCGEIWLPTRESDGRFHLLTHPNGGMLVDSRGRVVKIGDKATLRSEAQSVVDHGSQIILPGFVDAHLHYPQLDMIGAAGHPLLEWLDHWTFPHERKFASRAHAAEVATRLCHELLRHGVTSAGIYSSSHLDATEILCEAVLKSGLRAAIGKVSMDTMGPSDLVVSAQEDERQLTHLIRSWHRKHDRIQIALTPRFAPACSPEMLQMLGGLKAAAPDLLIQTHLSETLAEVELVDKIFGKTYTAVYADFGLLGPETLLGHGIHLQPSEVDLLASTKSTVVHCPSSNLFLGSGLMPLEKWLNHKLHVALGSDIGAGTSISPWRTMAAAYSVSALLGKPACVAQLLWLATAGGQHALHPKYQSWTLSPGAPADFVTLDVDHDPLLSRRRSSSDPLDFAGALITMGDERLMRSTWINGSKVWDKAGQDG
jgi:guanine deaminase